MKYRVFFNFDDGSSEDILDEEYDSIEAAEEAAREGASLFYQGNEYLKDAGEDYSDSKIIDWDIVESEDWMRGRD